MTTVLMTAKQESEWWTGGNSAPAPHPSPREDEVFLLNKKKPRSLSSCGAVSPEARLPGSRGTKKTSRRSMYNRRDLGSFRPHPERERFPATLMFAQAAFQSLLSAALAGMGVPDMEASPEDIQIQAYQLLKASWETTLKWKKEAYLAARSQLLGEVADADAHALRCVELFDRSEGKTLFEERLESCMPAPKWPEPVKTTCSLCGDRKQIGPASLCRWCLTQSKMGPYEDPTYRG